MHTPTTINIIVALLANKAKEIASDKLVKVILYGSYARGDYEEWSDIDVMVLVNGDDHTTKLFEQELRKYCIKPVFLTLLQHDWGCQQAQREKRL